MPPFDLLSPALFAGACAIALVAGVVKGAVGFAMPMIMISGLASVLPGEVAIAALILPTLASNLQQAFRQGGSAALAAVRAHWRFLATGGVLLLASAQLVPLLDGRAILALIGVPIVGFGLAQLAGWQPRVGPRARRPAEIGLGAVAGFVGGLSGVWGPPTVIYLTALDTPRVEQLRVLGVVFLLGAVLLTAAHLQSGVLNAATAPLSAALVVPAVIGMALGVRISDRLDQARFRRLTLIVLVVVGANLVRRAAMG